MFGSLRARRARRRNTAEEFFPGVMYRELRQWQTLAAGAEQHAVARGFAPETDRIPPTEPGGLPDGWQVRFNETVGYFECFLVEREAGGWAVIVTPRSYRAHWKVDGWGFADVADTVEHLWDKAFMSDGEATRQTLSSWFATLYDPHDAVEAAEQVMAALGGPITRLPAVVATL